MRFLKGLQQELAWVPRFSGDQTVAHLYGELEAGRWHKADVLLDAVDHEWFAHFCITGVGSEISTEVFQRWAKEKPSVRSSCLLGNIQIRDAWRIGRANRTKPPSANTMVKIQDALETASKTLSGAAELDQSSADPWAGLIAIGRGLRWDIDTMWGLFSQVQRSHAYRADACENMVRALSAEQGGTSEDAIEFAHQVEQEAPPGSPAAVVLPQAYHAHNLNVTRERGREMPNVSAQVELCAGARRFLSATPVKARTIDLGVLNWYLLMLAAADYESAWLAQSIIERIGSRPSYYPWSMFHEPAKAFVETRQLRENQIQEIAKNELKVNTPNILGGVVSRITASQ